MNLKLAIAQLNSTVGDLAHNAEQIYLAAQQAHAQGASVLLTPELALTGYPAEDLLLRPAFLRDCRAQLQKLQQRLAEFVDLHVVIGHPVASQNKIYNAASVCVNGQAIAQYYKQALPNYDVFDEQRYFSPGSTATVFKIQNVCFGLTICEDLWVAEPAQLAKQAGAQVLLSLNASPFSVGKASTRISVLKQHACDLGMSVVYVNAVGGQDELVFDGGSMVLNPQGERIVHLGQFKACTQVFSLSELVPALSTTDMLINLDSQATDLSPESQVYQALTLALKDYVQKNRFPGVLLGLSGGIDSALVMAIAVDALGADKVRAVMMPSQYTADISAFDAAQMAQWLGVRYQQIAISDIVQSFEQALAPDFAGLPPDTTEENLQARSRGVLLMALSNKTGALVVTTGNKSEMATGYCTLYGDMAGGFALLRDVPKTLVYRLSVWRNQQSMVIPERIITRPPSAELRPDQVDQDSLPDYAVLDDIILRYVEQNQTIAEILAAGHAPADVHKVVRLIRLNEYKRRQAAVGPKITARGFGRDWRYPITHRFSEEP